jgi:heptosyltransferase-2
MSDGKYRFALAGTDKDRQDIDIIKSKCGDNVYDLCGKLNLPELTELMKLCRLVISGDTGPMHIAEALNVPLIVIMGSSVREFGFFPQSTNSVIVENNGIKCRPCSHIGRPSCPQGHFKCMRESTPLNIFSLVTKFPL